MCVLALTTRQDSSTCWWIRCVNNMNIKSEMCALELLKLQIPTIMFIIFSFGLVFASTRNSILTSFKWDQQAATPQQPVYTFSSLNSVSKSFSYLELFCLPTDTHRLMHLSYTGTASVNSTALTPFVCSLNEKTLTSASGTNPPRLTRFLIYCTLFTSCDFCFSLSIYVDKVLTWYSNTMPAFNQELNVDIVVLW